MLKAISLATRNRSQWPYQNLTDYKSLKTTTNQCTLFYRSTSQSKFTLAFLPDYWHSNKP
jgi:hypothetical protein